MMSVAQSEVPTHIDELQRRGDRSTECRQEALMWCWSLLTLLNRRPR